MRPAVKICGIGTPAHALAAARSGAEIIGVVFAPSRRKVPVEAAKAIRSALDGFQSRPLLAGVFVNETHDILLKVAREAGLDIAQLSGDETPGEIAAIAQDIPVIKALRFPAGTSVQASEFVCWSIPTAPESMAAPGKWPTGRWRLASPPSTTSSSQAASTLRMWRPR
jgi:phosphoribosylanthranilate isomerase